MRTVIDKMRKDAWEVCQAALWAADAGNAIRRHLQWVGADLHIAGKATRIHGERRVWLLGAGKASALMAQAAREILGNRVAGGLVAVKYGHSVEVQGVPVLESGHPLSDAGSVRAAEQMVRLLKEETGSDDLVIFLLSGGASALLELPAVGLTLEDIIATSRLLLSCGANIHEMNCIRKHLSAIKGGQLARHASGIEMHTLVLSDVPGDNLDVIGSGPTVADSSTFSQAMAIVRGYGLEDRIPERVHHYLAQGCLGSRQETVKQGDPCLRLQSAAIVGSNLLSCEAAREKAVRLGYQVEILSTRVSQDNRVYARFLMDKIRKLASRPETLPAPLMLISGGETTVQLTGNGKGGRNQDLVLNCLEDLSHTAQPAVLVSLGTDGTDGPTDAAGAMADNFTLERHRGISARPLESFREENDSYHFFQPLGDLIITGPTGTNVMDLHLLLIHPPA